MLDLEGVGVDRVPEDDADVLLDGPWLALRQGGDEPVQLGVASVHLCGPLPTLTIVGGLRCGQSGDPVGFHPLVSRHGMVPGPLACCDVGFPGGVVGDVLRLCLPQVALEAIVSTEPRSRAGWTKRWEEELLLGERRLRRGLERDLQFSLSEARPPVGLAQTLQVDVVVDIEGRSENALELVAIVVQLSVAGSGFGFHHLDVEAALLGRSPLPVGLGRSDGLCPCSFSSLPGLFGAALSRLPLPSLTGSTLICQPLLVLELCEEPPSSRHPRPSPPRRSTIGRDDTAARRRSTVPAPHGTWEGP